MVIKMKCPSCRVKIAFDDTNEGKKMECPECGADLKVKRDPGLEKEDRNMDKENRETDSQKEENLDKTETETDQLEAVEEEEEEQSSDIEKDIEETSSNDPVHLSDREPWSILDIPQAFKAAGNGTALLISAALLFVILVAATIPRFVAVSFDSALMGYIFNGVTIAVFIIGFSIAMGTLSRMHNHVLHGNRSFSIADVTGYFFTHTASLALSPLKMMIMTAVLAGLEIFIFYLCKIPVLSYLYSILFFPLFILTAVIICMCIALFIMINLSSSAVGVDSYNGNAAFEKAHSIIKKKTGKVIAYTLLTAFIAGIVIWAVTWIGFTVFGTQQMLLVDKILVDEKAPLTRGADHYKSAEALITDTSMDKNGIDSFKGILFLISMYLTLSFLFSYPLSLFSALNTVSYLALKEDRIEV